MSENPFVVGALVVECSAGWHDYIYGSPRKIVKVHKNGRFVLENFPDAQYTPRESGLAGWTARCAGMGSYQRSYYEVLTPELQGRIAAQRQRRDWRKRQDELAKQLADRALVLGEERLARIEAIMKEGVKDDSQEG